MGKKFSIAVIGLMLLCTSQVWAGTSGNGAPQVAQTRFAFCYAGNVKIVYFSDIVTFSTTIASSFAAAKLAHAYGDYVTKTYGLPGFDRLRCVTADSNADVVAAKKTYGGMFGKAEIIEIEWAGPPSVVVM